MNRIYKIIWSKAKNAYVVTSEIAKSHTKGTSGKVVKASLAAAVGLGLLMGGYTANAAIDGVNKFVEAGNQNIKIGNDISLRNNSTKNGAIAIGDHAQIDDYVMQEGSIAIGKNAFVENMWGLQDKIFRFRMNATDPSRTDHLLPAGIAIGQNTYARSGGVMIGDHKYVGQLGDTTVDSNTDAGKRKLAVLVGATTVGLNSYSAGAFATTTGAYSIMTNLYDGNTNQGSGAQNFGAVINGSFNSIESKTASSSVSGIANAVVGTANRTNNANGTLVFGAGNEVTNSVDNIATPMSLWVNSPKELATKLRENIRNNDSGGAVLAIGGGNKADYAQRSQIIGVKNTLTGTDTQKSIYNMIDGYNNTGTNVSGVTIIGTNRTVSNAKNTLVLGSSAAGTSTTVSDAVILGAEANATKDGGVALGSSSVASVDKGVAGYDPATKAASTGATAAWKSTHAAVSVGNGSTVTRQITGVAAGTNDTDAVNVAQLKAIAGSAGSGIHFVSVKGGSETSVNYNNKGATETGAIAIGANATATASGAVALGFNTHAAGTGGVVIGESSSLIPNTANQGEKKGVSSLIIGNENLDAGGTKEYAGSNDSIVGTSNVIKESNGAFVNGSYNNISDSYQFAPSSDDMQKLFEAMIAGKPTGAYIGKMGSHVFVTGDGNTVSKSTSAIINGSQNTVTNSSGQTVIGDKNSVTDRNVGTVSGKHDVRPENVSDLVIGKGNKISGNDTYMKGYESLTVIGNNNTAVNPSASILIGDNRHLSATSESVTIGSMKPEERDVEDLEVAGGTVSVGYGAVANGGMGIAIGHNTKSAGMATTVVGSNSLIKSDAGGFSPVWSSIYGSFNAMTDDDNGSFANSVVGTLNKVDRSTNTLALGSGNKVDHAFAGFGSGLNGKFLQGSFGEVLWDTGHEHTNIDRYAKLMGEVASESGGSVLALGNGNTADYAVRSQLTGTGNTLTGKKNALSTNTTLTGFRNTGDNLNDVSVMGTGNQVKDSSASVVIGDYHEVQGGKNNVILGAMKTKEIPVDKTYLQQATNDDGSTLTVKRIPYTVKSTVAVKKHMENVNNAVMLGYNTDVTKDGGVALGSESVASVDKGVYGYNPLTGKKLESEAEIAKLSGKEAEITQINTALPTLQSDYTAAKTDYDGKLADYLSKSAAYTAAYQTYHEYDHSGDQYDLARKKAMEDAKAAMDAAKTAMDSAQTAYATAEGKYTAAVATKNQILGTWQANAAAVSVGDAATGLTRQITNVAAGTQDTDAVNVAQLKALNTKLTSGAVHYYSVKSDEQGAGSNYANDGAKAKDSMVIGINSVSEGANSTVIGNNNKLTGNKNNRNNSIVVGQNLTVDGAHNAVFGTDYANYDYKKTLVAGEHNTVLGIGNLVGYTAEKDPNDATKWVYTKKGSSSDQNVVVGLTNTANVGSVVVGTSSVADSLGTSLGHGNTIIGMNDGGGQRGVAIGNNLTVKGEEAVAIGTKAEATADWTLAMGSNAKAEKEQDMAIGYEANAKGKYSMAFGNYSGAEEQVAVAMGYNAHAKSEYGVALGSLSVADRAAGTAGYDPSTKAASTDESAVWKANLGAVSVGDKTEGYTRQITNVAAGKEDTDAVNVAQLKAVANQATTEAAKHTTVEAGDYVTVTESTNNSGGTKYTVNGPAITSTDGTVKIEDKVENGKKVGYNLSVDTSKLNIKDMHVKEGTVTYDADGKGTMELTHQDGTKATVTGIKDTKLQTSDNALKLDGKKLSMSVKDTAGNEVKGSVDLAAIAGEVDTNTTYEMTSTTDSANNTTTIKLAGKDKDGNSVSEQTVTVATKDTRNTVKAGENVSLTEASNTLGGTEYTINVKADGKVEKGNTKIISGGTVYKETRVKEDGNYVKKDNTAGQNLSALDKQVGTNTQNITNNTKMINELGGQVSNLDNRISKVGAGAAALAALHPLDFDPHDKWDIAAGFGNYRNASAAAVGLFYRPNERTMFSLSATMGDDRNMFNAGVSVKLGSGSTYSGLSKAEMADRLEKQDEKMEKMESELEELKAQIAQLAAKK